METKYIFVLDTKGIRVTSFLIGLHADTKESCIQLAQTLYPNHTYLAGTQEMQNEFVANTYVITFVTKGFLICLDEINPFSNAGMIAIYLSQADILSLSAPASTNI